MSSSSTTQIREWVERCRRGEASARDGLLTYTQGRLAAIVRKTRREKFAFLRQEFETDEVMQELYLRLLKRWDEFKLQDVVATDDPVKLYFAFTARIIRDILCDAVRKRYGRGKNPRPKASSLDDLVCNDDGSSPQFDPSEETHDPERIAMWADVHGFIESLPEPLREVADLHWYHDLTHNEVGELLGIAEVTSRTRWARVRHELLQKFPESPFDWAA